MPGDIPGSVEARLRAAVEFSPSGLLMSDRHGVIVLVNREIERLFGYAREELLGHPVELLLPESQRPGHVRRRSHYDQAPMLRGMGAGRDLTGRRKDGRVIPLEIGLTPVPTADGTYVLAAIVDISARKEAEEVRRKLEEQLRHAQKMEAVGTLAGGIAHDFNNILGVILGYLDVLRHAITDPASADDLLEMERASLRGRELVKRILSFARRAEPDLQVVDVASATERAAKSLRVTLPAGVDLRVTVDRGVPRIQADLTALHQVILNLVNNGAQAMPQGGLLEVSVSALEVHDHVARAHPDLHEGRYVEVTVRDSGTGMDPKTQERAFEPFFTTKAGGLGTGLGLAMVHGILKDHGGACLLESAPGRGTRVRCLFPSLEVGAGEPVEEMPGEIPRGAGERILVLDDMQALMEVEVTLLQRLGYDAVGFVDAEDAVRAMRSATPPFVAVLTDFLMPKVNGVEFAGRVAAMMPGTPIVLVTGYNEVTSAELAGCGVVRVLQKPVSLTDLAHAMHFALARPGTPA